MQTYMRIENWGTASPELSWEGCSSFLRLRVKMKTDSQVQSGEMTPKFRVDKQFPSFLFLNCGRLVPKFRGDNLFPSQLWKHFSKLENGTGTSSPKKHSQLERKEKA